MRDMRKDATMSRLAGKLGAVCAALVTASLFACSAPAAEVLDSPIVEEMKEGRQSGSASFDHSEFDALLDEHVDLDKGRVDYAGLKEDREKFDAYLDKIAEVEIEELGEDEQLALLINAYNAYTLDSILEEYPDIDSIRDLSDPFEAKRHKVASYTLSLDDIEHKLIRPIFKDSRIHFAVNCAARDCPPLRPDAYTGGEIDDQLDEATADVLGSSQFVRVEGDELRVTKIMDWYGDDFVDEDFDGHASSLPAYIEQHTPDDDVRSFIEAHDGEPSVSFLDYDWRLNDVSDDD